MKLFAFAAAMFFGLQSPGAPPNQQQPAKSTIEGMVVRAGTGEPLAGAKVTVMPAVGSVGPVNLNQRTTTTDKEGKFFLKDIEAGQYRVLAARNGYARQECGQQGVGRPGIAVNIMGGQVISNVVISLLPAAVVTGRVTNDAGEPIVGIDITLLRPAYMPGGGRTLNTFAFARTNDLGEYRLYWVTPGRYFLSASSSQAFMRVPNANEVLDDVYGTVYYPGTFDASAAGVLDIRPGADIGGIDLRTTPQQTYHVRGRIIDATTGRPPRNTSVNVDPRQRTGMFTSFGGGPNYNGAAGTFDLANVLPGSYWLRVVAADDGLATPATVRKTAQIPLDVAQDVNDVVVTLTPGIPVPGHIQVEGKASFSELENADRIRIMLSPTASGLFSFGTPPPVPKVGGVFTFDNVSPGEYRVSIFGLPPEYFIKDVRLGATDILRSGFSLTPPLSERIEIVVSPNAGQLEGDIVNDRGEKVRGIQAVLIPDRDRERTELFRTAAADQNGHFIIKGIAPGTYKLFAWEELDQFAYYDPEILRRYEAQGKPVTVSELDKLTMQVKAIPTEQ